MVFIIFGLAAIITVLAAIELSNSADILSKKTSLGGFLVGTLLLGGATSLPELTTSISSIVINNPDIAVGNLLGSNMFNIFIIACFDLYYRKKRLFELASPGHMYTAGLGLTLSAMTLVALLQKSEYTVLWVGADSLLIVFIYSAGMYVISRVTTELTDNQVIALDFGEKVKGNTKSTPSLVRALFTFFIAAIIIMITGTLLSISGDTIADITGIGSTFIGSFLMAATTSLPEAVAVLIALRLRNVNLAIGSILGSNIFNLLILVGTDIIYTRHPIFAVVAPLHEITAMTVTGLSVLITLSLMRNKVASTVSYMIPSLLIIVGYFIALYLIFNG